MNKIVHLIILILLSSLNAVIADEQEHTLLRLFTTQAERKNLNDARERFLKGIETSQEMESYDGLLSQEVTYNGIIQRSDGHTDIWVNGVGISKGDKKSQRLSYKTNILKDKSIRLTLPEGDRIRLKTGQVYQFNTGKVHEGYQSTRVQVLQEPESVSDELGEQSEGDDKPNKQEKENNNDKNKAKNEKIEFDETALAEQISRIRLLEERIEELETIQKTR